jgi:quercetin dioxygenase-like cupin family protein
MQHWNLREIDTPSGTRSPVVLDSDDTGRAVLIGLDPGQRLGEHEVKEHAYLLVVDGTVRIETSDGDSEASAGTLLLFAPTERHAVSSQDGARVLLFLAPWPGEGHYRGGDRPRPSAT